MTNYLESVAGPEAVGSQLAGILGGLGPLASAEFLNTIYELAGPEAEQFRPRVVLLSDPSFPDRSTALLNGQSALLAAHLERRLKILREVGASQVIICCFTLHSVLPLLPPAVRKNVISLVNVALEEMLAMPGRHLLLCSNGSRELRLFESHARWNEVADRVLWPDQHDQAMLHHAIYEVKAGSVDCGIDNLLRTFRRRYAADWLVAGCTELHIVAKRWARTEGTALFIDPLRTVAHTVARLQSNVNPEVAICQAV